MEDELYLSSLKNTIMPLHEGFIVGEIGDSDWSIRIDTVKSTIEVIDQCIALNIKEFNYVPNRADVALDDDKDMLIHTSEVLRDRIKYLAHKHEELLSAKRIFTETRLSLQNIIRTVFNVDAESALRKKLSLHPCEDVDQFLRERSAIFGDKSMQSEEFYKVMSYMYDFYSRCWRFYLGNNLRDLADNAREVAKLSLHVRTQYGVLRDLQDQLMCINKDIQLLLADEQGQ